MAKGMWTFLIDYKATMSRREKIGISIFALIYFAFMGFLYSVGQIGLIGIGVLTAFGVAVVWCMCWATKHLWDDAFDEDNDQTQ